MRLISTLLIFPFLFGCQSAYYATMEHVGIHKRDIMVERVEETVTAQHNASQEFTSALEALTSMTQFTGNDLQIMYHTFNDRYHESQSAVEQVSERIADVESVAMALFNEWRNELDLYQSDKLRQESEKQLMSTEKTYNQMVIAIKKAETKMLNVLAILKDNTLYLKHNLNASALGSLQGEFHQLEQQINIAITEMHLSIGESERFVATLKKEFPQ